MTVEETLIIDGESADAVQALENIERAAEDAASSVGEIQQQASQTTNSLKSGLTPALDASAGGTVQFASGVSRATGIIGAFSSALSGIISAMPDATNETKQMAAEFASVATAAAAGAAAFGPWGAVIAGAIAGITALNQRLEREEEAHEAASEAIRQQITDLDALMAQMGDVERLRRLENGLASVAEANNAVRLSSAELGAANVALGRSHSHLDDLVEDLAEVEEQLGDRQRLRNHEVRALRAEQIRLTEAVRVATDANFAAGVVVDNLVDAHGRLNAGLQISVERQTAATAARNAAAAAETRRSRALSERAAERERAIEIEKAAQIEAVRLANELGEERLAAEADFAARAEAFRKATLRNQVAEAERAAAIEQRLLDQSASAAQAAALADAERIQRTNELRSSAMVSMSVGVNSFIANLEATNEAAAELGKEGISSMEAWGGATVAVASEMTQALGTQLAGGIASAIKAVVTGEKTFDEAMKSMLESVLFSVGQQALVNVLLQIAEAISAGASLNAPKAAAHVAAAIAWGAVAAAALGGGAAMAGAGASAGAADAGGGAGGPPAGADAGTGATAGAAPVSNTYIFPGTPLGSTSDDLVRQFNRLDRLNGRREGRR